MRDLSGWPVTVDVQYDEDGPGLLCNQRVDQMAYGGRCFNRLEGDTWGELEQALRAHIDSWHPGEEPRRY